MELLHLITFNTVREVFEREPVLDAISEDLSLWLFENVHHLSALEKQLNQLALFILGGFVVLLSFQIFEILYRGDDFFALDFLILFYMYYFFGRFVPYLDLL